MMEFFAADYVILSLSGIAATFGLFAGFSGGLAFLLGTVAAVFGGRVFWACSGDIIASAPLRALAVAVVALVAFGLVRMIVKRTIHSILAQPGDAILGALAYAASVFAAAVGVIWAADTAGMIELNSRLVSGVLGLVG